MARLGRNRPIVPPLPEATYAQRGMSRRDLWRVQSPDLDKYGALTIPTRAVFEAMSHRDNIPGAIGVREVKFLITDVNTPSPVLYFMNMQQTVQHYTFARRGLGLRLSTQEFNRLTYFSETRSFIAGSIIAHDRYTHADGTQGLYTVEFWPSDILQFARVHKTYTMIQDAMPFARGQIAYHPTGDGQRDRLEAEIRPYTMARIATVQTDEIYANIPYSPLHLGETIGRLGVFGGDSGRPSGPMDIAIFTRLPNDLARVAGVISQTPQTPLSHVNLRAQQNGIPNAYLRGAATHSELVPYIGQIIRLEVIPDGLRITPATPAQMEAFFADLRPPAPQTPQRDLSVTAIAALDDIGFADAAAFGAKAANVAELRRILDPAFVPQGFAIPYSFYDRFMHEAGLYTAIREMISHDGFAPDPSDPNRDMVRRATLKDIRKLIKAAPLPDDLYDALTQLQSRFASGITPRCRSSANAEDLTGFSGAGLYDSYTHKADEGHLSKSIKQVWASLWTYRAFEERTFYRIDHFACAMGVLVHPNFKDELVNGVAVTQNIYFPDFPGYYVNVQVGEDMITNPTSDAIAEEVLIMQNAGLETLQEFVTLRIRESNLTVNGAPVLSNVQTNLLVAQMALIQRHFKTLYAADADADADSDFAMEIEFKIDRDGILAIKQARPWTV